MVELNHVYKVYERNWVALKDFNMRVEKGEFVFLVGPSGAGKSTVLRLIYMDQFPTGGEVVVSGYSSSTMKVRDIPLLRRRIGVIFQDFKLLKERDVFDNVSFALRVTGAPRKFIKKKVLQTLADVRLSHKRNFYPYQLSGGEQQKVAIARALVRDPFVLLADEPTGNIDPEGSEEIIDLLKDINARGTAVLMATHNRGLVEKTAFRTVFIEKGEVKETQSD